MLSEPGSVFFWHVLGFGLSSVLSLGSAVWTYRRRDRYAAQALFAFLAVTVAWNATVLLRIVGPLSLAWELHLVEQFFQVLVTLVWFYFTAVYVGYRDVIARPLVAHPLGGVAAGMLAVESFPPVAAVTNTNPTAIEDPFAFVTWTDTELAGVVEVLALAAFAVGSGLILYKLLTTNYVQAWQVALVFFATSGAVLVEVFESAIPHAASGVDYPALAVTGVGVSYVVGLYRYDLFGYTPVDTSDVIDGITAPVFVLNPEQRVVDFNAPANATFDGLASGRKADAALPEAVVDAVPLDDPETSRTEVTLTRDGEDRIYRLYAASLDSFGDSRGLAITVEDNGHGIPESEIAVLERGYEDVLNHGSGIGLWIVTMVVDEIDGTIEYDAGDDGTEITLRIEN